MRFSARLFTFASLAPASATFTACSDDKDDVKPVAPKYEVPATYNFANVNYSGQQARLATLGELDTSKPPTAVRCWTRRSCRTCTLTPIAPSRRPS